MTQAISNPETPASAAQTVHLCTVDDCHEPAVAGYQWDWGERGTCCAKHQFLLRQKQPTIGRGLQFAVLPGATTSALTRDERTRMHAMILTLEDELRDAKARGLELYQSNTKLAEESRRLAARNRELEGQVKDGRAELQQLGEQHDTHLADLQDARDELNRVQRVQALMPKPEEAKPVPPDDEPPGDPEHWTDAGQR
jgi:hypothetical protein